MIDFIIVAPSSKHNENFPMEKGRPTGVLFPIAGLLPTIEEIVPDIPPPAAAALVQTAEKLHIAAGGQPHQQRQAVFPLHRVRT